MSELTIPAAAEKYGRSHKTLRLAAEEGRLSARKLGPIWVTTDAAVTTWIAHGKHRPGRAAKRTAQ